MLVSDPPLPVIVETVAGQLASGNTAVSSQAFVSKSIKFFVQPNKVYRNIIPLEDHGEKAQRFM